MTAIIKARLSGPVAHEVIVTGTRYGAELARERGIVDRVAAEDEVVPCAVEMAAGLASKADPVMARLKSGMYGHVLEALRSTMPPLD